MKTYKGKISVTVLGVITCLCLASCSSADTFEPVTETDTAVSTVSETETAETEVSEVSETPYYTTYVDNTASYTIFWTENDELKSEAVSGILSPDNIIHSVLNKYGYEEVPDLGAADWIVTEFYSDIEDDEGLKRIKSFSATLDIDEGFSAFAGEDAKKIAADIGKSLIVSYDLKSVRICELKEDIVSVSSDDL